MTLVGMVAKGATGGADIAIPACVWKAARAGIPGDAYGGLCAIAGVGVKVPRACP